MSRLETRLRRVEDRYPPPPSGRRHVLLGASDEDFDAQEADLKAAGKWSEGDTSFRIMLVPGTREDALEGLE